MNGRSRSEVRTRGSLKLTLGVTGPRLTGHEYSTLSIDGRQSRHDSQVVGLGQRTGEAAGIGFLAAKGTESILNGCIEILSKRYSRLTALVSVTCKRIPCCLNSLAVWAFNFSRTRKNRGPIYSGRTANSGHFRLRARG